MNSNLTNINKGNIGENVAVDYLLQNGFIVLERNWRYKHWEVDIIVHKNNKLHIVEVKTRTNKKFGNPEESIGTKKMTALKNAAEGYLIQYPQWTKIQFDVVAVSLNEILKAEIFYIEDVYF